MNLHNKHTTNKVIINRTHILIIACLILYINTMDSFDSSQNINLQNLFLKFETNTIHNLNQYGFEIYIRCSYINIVSNWVFTYTSYLQPLKIDNQVIVVVRRRDDEKVKNVFRRFIGTKKDSIRVETMKSDIDFIVLTALQHIDDYLVSHIKKDEYLQEQEHRLKSIDGVWKREFSWQVQGLEEVNFCGIFETEAFKYIEYEGTPLVLFMQNEQNKKILKVGSEREFEIIKNLLESVHQKQFKNEKLNFYKFLIDNILQHQLNDKIYIHKRCIDILRLFDNEVNDQPFTTLLVKPTEVYLPYMCYFTLLVEIKNRFSASLFIEEFKKELESIHRSIIEYLHITSVYNKKSNLFVKVNKSLIIPILKYFVKDKWESFSSCKVESIEDYQILDSEIFEKLNGKIYESIMTVFDKLILSADKIKDSLKKGK